MLNGTIITIIFAIRINDYNHDKLWLTIKPKLVHQNAGP